MSDKRREPRNSCYLRAEIYTELSAPPIIAEAHDISDHGMRLKVLNARTLPNTFMVSIPRRHIREMVEIKRRSEGEVGVLIRTLDMPRAVRSGR
ncbi:MAG: hypothetical protein O9322_01410 [Beijerinckiaceae bacterium]|nr:hypothetical protein [Beijerinckiaceae bacterium]MCZ8301920.1 hypothetical protein [Beijerinckiaceae bacterium]